MQPRRQFEIVSANRAFFHSLPFNSHPQTHDFLQREPAVHLATARGQANHDMSASGPKADLKPTHLESALLQEAAIPTRDHSSPLRAHDLPKYDVSG
jgi:hypothetical protein